MTLTGRFFAIYGFLQLIGVLGALYEPAAWVYVALTALFIALAIWDRRSLPEARDFSLTARVPRAVSLAQPTQLNARVELLSSRAFQSLELRLIAPPIDLFDFDEPQFAFRPVDAIDGRYEHEFTAQVKELGYVKLSVWPLSALSTFGLFKLVMQIEVEPVEFRVSPERIPLREQAFTELIQTQRVLNPGARLQARARSADVFHSIRKYQFPDSIRHIDAKKTARYGELMTRVFEEQHNHHLVIAFDTGRAMSGSVRGSRKSDYYLSAALALAENAVKTRDQVSLISFAQTSRSTIRRARSLLPFQALFRSAPAFAPRDEETDYGLLPRLIGNVAGSRAIVIVLTDLSKPSVQDSLLEALAPVCRKHLTVVLSLSDRENSLEEKLAGISSAENGGNLKSVNLDLFKEQVSDLLYAYWSKERHVLFRERFARLGGGSLVVNDADWMSSVEKLYALLRTSRFA